MKEVASALSETSPNNPRGSANQLKLEPQLNIRL